MGSFGNSARSLELLSRGICGLFRFTYTTGVQDFARVGVDVADFGRVAVPRRVPEFAFDPGDARHESVGVDCPHDGPVLGSTWWIFRPLYWPTQVRGRRQGSARGWVVHRVSERMATKEPGCRLLSASNT